MGLQTTIFTILILIATSLSIAEDHSNNEYAMIDTLQSEFPHMLNGVRYFHKWHDLNGDGKDEAIVYLVGSYVCGTGGCNTLILEPKDGKYIINSKIGITRPPIIVEQTATNGWQDLAVFVSGGGLKEGFYATVRHNDGHYNSNPSMVPEQDQSTAEPDGIQLIKPNEFAKGTLLYP